MKTKKIISILLMLVLILSAFTVIPSINISVSATGYGSNGKFLAPIEAIEDKTGWIAISNRTDLEKIGTTGYPLDGKYYLTTDINLFGANWMPIGWISESSTNSFTGTFDGQGYVIHNLTIVAKYRYNGLFAFVQNAIIKNIGLEGTNINANWGPSSSQNPAFVGGILGYASDILISNCYNIGNITSTDEFIFSGGIGGRVSGTVINCYNSSNVSNSTYAGGILGTGGGTGSTITNSYNTGNISAYNNSTSYAGGICAFFNTSSNSNGTIK